MELVLQLCSSKSAIKQRMAQLAPELFFELIGEDWDYSISIPHLEEEDAAYLYEALQDIVYGDGEYTLAELLVAELFEKGLQCAMAESCTGGMVASALVGCDGASRVFYEGIVAYANQAKLERLGVSLATLQEFGAVSEEVASEMAEGLLVEDVALAISTTGIAGPTGGTPTKPVGTVCIAVAGQKGTHVRTYHFAGNRQEVRNKAKNVALFCALSYLRAL